ncbi:MAG: hypothetical protein A2289_08040 [Deltaproteobacteria bacterium RIFOXYA12_FULL_58_15]|nr:MAG: hypothetical protein A2289_08040 [Deltaproteobacteria bacterium RIFOXYA12_FULL_58_15]OGR10350.1 MAG: hypothetical protein A2341_22800 [Deltaproteobacteria bacterium RIFOXYB12_FULL_58_9]
MSQKHDQPQSPLREIVQPFVDLVRAPRALWGINLAYVLEGMAYFGVLGYLALHFSDFVFIGVENPNEIAHKMVGILTAGITISMFFLGFIADKKGIRFALLWAFVLLLGGRVLISAAPTIMGLEPNGVWSPLHLVTMAGILLIVVGYGMYQPAAYAGVRQFTNPKNAAMAFAMLYALMNLGGWLPTFAFMLRDDDWLGIGIPGVLWVYTAFTAVALVTTWLILSKPTIAAATKTAEEETARIRAEEGTEEHAKKVEDAAQKEAQRPATIRPHVWLVWSVTIVIFYFVIPQPANFIAAAVMAIFPLAIVALPLRLRTPIVRFISRHPLSNARFSFFIFCLIPVQTLFTYNWFVLPQYIQRSFDGWIGEYFEIASNANPILIFILAPVIAAATRKSDVYKMMILGTTVMAAPAFLLVLGPYWWTLFGYILLMTVGEAMWQPRFLQWAAEIAPKGRTGEYMGVAQIPWFLTKLLVPLLYSGKMMDKFCPAQGPKDTQTMWLVFAVIAMGSPLLLVLAKRWMGKELEEKA